MRHKWSGCYFMALFSAVGLLGSVGSVSSHIWCLVVPIWQQYISSALIGRLACHSHDFTVLTKQQSSAAFSWSGKWSEAAIQRVPSLKCLSQDLRMNKILRKDKESVRWHFITNFTKLLPHSWVASLAYSSSFCLCSQPTLLLLRTPDCLYKHGCDYLYGPAARLSFFKKAKVEESITTWWHCWSCQGRVRRLSRWRCPLWRPPKQPSC